nr:hypothetical protein [Tanacetum cinerariifolium]
ARNYEILHERDDDDTEQKSGDRHQPTTQQSSHRNHGHNNDRHGSDRRGGSDNHRRSNNNYSGGNNRHSVLSSAFASRVTTTPTLLYHVLCISTPMQDSVRITHVYRNLPLQFDDKIRAINALPLDMCEFNIILGMDWLTEHHAMIDCSSYRVIFGFLATIHDTTSDVPSIHDQPIVSEFLDVFPDELPGIPSVREVEFDIELISRAKPISKAPYGMALIELKEL